MSPPLRLLFAGTPVFAVPVLDAVSRSGHRLLGVFTQPDRPAGRGRRLAPSPVKQRAQALGVEVFEPASLKTPEAVALVEGLAADLLIVVAYGVLLPKPILEAPRLGCINVHASLLPRWRGAAPIQRTILAGDAVTGITLMQMDEGLDTGAVLAQRSIPIQPRETAGQLSSRLAALGAELIEDYLTGTPALLTPVAQDEGLVTYAAKVKKEEAVVDWGKPASELDRQIRAFNPWPVAETRLSGRQLRIWDAEVVSPDAVAEPGRVVQADATGLIVGTGRGLLGLLRVQLAGKRPVMAADFVNAQRVLGASLG